MRSPYKPPGGLPSACLLLTCSARASCSRKHQKGRLPSAMVPKVFSQDGQHPRNPGLIRDVDPGLAPDQFNQELWGGPTHPRWLSPPAHASACSDLRTTAVEPAGECLDTSPGYNDPNRSLGAYYTHLTHCPLSISFSCIIDNLFLFIQTASVSASLPGKLLLIM